jgi:hypothetical protein
VRKFVKLKKSLRMEEKGGKKKEKKRNFQNSQDFCSFFVPLILFYTIVYAGTSPLQAHPWLSVVPTVTRDLLFQKICDLSSKYRLF